MEVLPINDNYEDNDNHIVNDEDNYNDPDNDNDKYDDENKTPIITIIIVHYFNVVFIIIIGHYYFGIAKFKCLWRKQMDVSLGRCCNWPK